MEIVGKPLASDISRPDGYTGAKNGCARVGAVGWRLAGITARASCLSFIADKCHAVSHSNERSVPA